MLKIIKNRVFFIFAIVLLVASCGKEQFSAKKKNENSTTNSVQQSNTSSCSAFTLIKPQVDFLFLWDNSTSTIFINNETKTALNNTIDLISSKFDYHIMMAPLLGSGNAYAKFISDTPVGLTSSALAIKIDRSQAASALSFPPVQGSYEAGLERARQLLSSNISNGIFRQNAYTVVVVMSNEDDNSWVSGGFPTAFDRTNYINDKVNKLLCLRGNYVPAVGTPACSGATLNSLQMRFISIVAHQDKCGGSQPLWKQNRVYKEVSSTIYSSSYTNGTPAPTDQGNPQSHPDGIIPYDTYNICDQSNFVNLFDGINNSIQDTLIKHKYNYWPVATTGSSAIDPNEVRVFKDGQEISQSTSNGFTFTNSIQTQNTRYEPTAGEPFTGYLVRLYGNARVTYPECMSVTTQTPKEFYGYIQLQSKPLESSIVLKINGATIPKSSTNGWQLLKISGQPRPFTSKNIKILPNKSFCPSSSTTYCGGSPAENKSGYFLQVFGNAVYSNGANVQVVYDPSS